MTVPLYIVAYDVADRRRWRRVFRLLEGHGLWLQLSVFRCRLTADQRRRLLADLEREIDQASDRVIMARIDSGAPGGLHILGQSPEPMPRYLII